MEDFTRELTPGNTKAAMKAVGAVSADLWQVEPTRLRILEGFNARIKTDAYTGRVRWWTKPLLFAAGALYAAVFRWGIKVEVEK